MTMPNLATLTHEPATDAELASYKRGVESGAMESASPSVVGSLLKRIASEREGLIAKNALLELANHAATNELAKTFKLEAKIEALSEALREIIGEELSGESNPNVEDDNPVHSFCMTFGMLRRARAALDSLDREREKNRVLAIVSDTLKSTKLLPCNCGREVNMGGCTGCGYHPLDCSCFPEGYDAAGWVESSWRESIDEMNNKPENAVPLMAEPKQRYGLTEAEIAEFTVALPDPKPRESKGYCWECGEEFPMSELIEDDNPYIKDETDPNDRNYHCKACEGAD